jgi:hypothetical protein
MRRKYQVKIDWEDLNKEPKVSVQNGSPIKTNDKNNEEDSINKTIP